MTPGDNRQTYVERTEKYPIPQEHKQTEKRPNWTVRFTMRLRLSQ